MKHRSMSLLWLATMSLLAALPLAAQAPFVAAHSTGFAGGDDAWGLALDGQGNTYTAGYGSHATLSKRSPAGSTLWAVGFGDAATVPYGLAIDGSGGMAMVGAFAGSVDFDPGPGEQWLEAANGAVFVARFVGTGQLAWVRQFHGGNAHTQGVAVDSSGSVFATCHGSGVSDFDPGPGIAEMDVLGAWLVKLDVNGSYQWARTIEAFPYAVETDPSSGGVLWVGDVSGPFDLDPGPGVALAPNAGSSDAFVVKLDGAGNYQWGHAIGSPGLDEGVGLGVDAAGRVAISGYGGSPMDLDPGPGLVPASGNPFLVVLDANGQYLSGVRLQPAGRSWWFDAGFDGAGNVYVTGDLDGTMDADPGAGTSEFNGGPSPDAFVASYTAAGEFRWAATAGNAGGSEVGFALANMGDRVAVATRVFGTTDFDPGVGIAEVAAIDGSDAVAWIFEAGDNSLDQAVFVADYDGSIVRLAPDGSGRQTVLSGLGQPTALAYDPIGADLYFTQSADNLIRRAKVDGSGLTTLATAPSRPYGLALHPSAGKMYWSEDVNASIWRANLDGSQPELLLGAPDVVGPAGLWIDAPNGHLYWADYHGGYIGRVNLDGTGRVVLVSGRPAPNHVAVDAIDGALFWTEGGGESNTQVLRAALNGSAITSLDVLVAHPTGIGLDNVGNRLFVGNELGMRVSAVNADGSAGDSYWATGFGRPIGVLHVNFGNAPPVPNATVRLLDSTGNGLAGANVTYYNAGWKPFGVTGADGRAGLDLADGSYTFRIEYAGASVQKSQNIALDPLVIFQTHDVAVQLRDSSGNPLDTGTAEYYASGWKPFGSTSGGEVHKELLPTSYTFAISYAGARVQKAQNIAGDPSVIFQTRDVAVQLRDSSGNPLDTGTAEYYASGWKPLGSTSSGEVHKELLPTSYTFAISYAGARVQKAQNIASDPSVIFQTRDVAVQLRDSSGNPLDTGTAEYYASGWKPFGSTSGGEVHKELLPTSYTFAINYAGARVQKAQNVASDPLVVFQTGAVVSASATCTSYYAGGWRSFTQGMQLLPISYTFRFSSGTPMQEALSISGGIENSIR